MIFVVFIGFGTHLQAGNRFAVFLLNDSIVLKQLELPALKDWDKVMKPLRSEARARKLSDRDVGRMIKESRRLKA
ncbi:MAG: hypothetical protein J4432_03540 [DPANN group archaeon]|nr:hypothetical protein [DPANN group archaeon]